jgi:hypothetical protein
VLVKATRVFALAPDCHVAGWRYAPVWSMHFYAGLRSAGVEVVIPSGVTFDWARPVRSDMTSHEGIRASTSSELLRQIEASARNGLDAVVSYCFSHDLELELVDQVRAAGIPWINFFCDSVYAFHTVEALARRTSLNWFVELEATGRYASLGVPYLRAPYALNPGALPDASCTTPTRALSFVGTANRDRLDAAMKLRLMGIDLHVSGWGWTAQLGGEERALRGPIDVLRALRRSVARRLLEGRVGDHIEGATFHEYLRSSRTVLGLNEGRLPGGRPVSYLKLRDIEFPGMGCAYVTQRNDDVESAFESGREVRTFGSLYELRHVLRELARDPVECARMGARARRRVLAEHTWAVRLPQLFEALG